MQMHVALLLLQVPSAATVYCQPIQLRCANALGFSVEQANRWRWRPDYEGIDLADCRSGHTLLQAAPQLTPEPTHRRPVNSHLVTCKRQSWIWSKR